MKIYNIREFVKGWFIGDFEKTILRTKEFEVAVKSYKSGDYEARHTHKIATEITVIVRGMVKMNGAARASGDIIVIEPGESTDFEVLSDTITVCVKIPSVIGDKYVDNQSDAK